MKLTDEKRLPELYKVHRSMFVRIAAGLCANERIGTVGASYIVNKTEDIVLEILGRGQEAKEEDE